MSLLEKNGMPPLKINKITVNKILIFTSGFFFNVLKGFS